MHLVLIPDFQKGREVKTFANCDFQRSAASPAPYPNERLLKVRYPLQMVGIMQSTRRIALL